MEAKNMKRILREIMGLLLIGFAFGLFLWIRPELGWLVHAPSEGQEDAPTQRIDPIATENAQPIKDTILRAVRINIEAAYTFDTSQLATVYTNDPRGGEISPEALALIQEIRQDPTLRIDQVGVLDFMQTNVEHQKQVYDNYMAELRAKQADGTISAEEQFILDGETNGWPTPTPNMAGPSPAPLPCMQPGLPTSTPAQPYPTLTPNPYPTGYPDPSTLATTLPYTGPYTIPTATEIPTLNPQQLLTAYPVPEVLLPTVAARVAVPGQFPLCNGTPVPGQITSFFRVAGRGANPALLPPESFEVDIESITIDGEVARALVGKPGMYYEQVLVKVNGQWYLGGARISSCCG
jgi:hypothetical protein